LLKLLLPLVIAVEKHQIRLPHGAIRLIGDYAIDINLHSDVM